MFRYVIIRRAYNTFKSNNDEQLNQALLGRLKHVPKMGEKRVNIRGEQVKDSPYRKVTFNKLGKILNLYTSDPLIWDSSTLCRIFNMPHDMCYNLVKYTKPLATIVDCDMDEPKQLVETSIVIDIGRLKSDKNYLPHFKKLVFIEEEKPIERRALE